MTIYRMYGEREVIEGEIVIQREYRWGSWIDMLHKGYRSGEGSGIQV